MKYFYFTCSQTYFIHAEKGASSGTLILIKYFKNVIKTFYVLNGRLGSDERVILKVTFYFCIIKLKKNRYNLKLY